MSERFTEAFPIFHTSDLERAVAFYTERLGFEEVFRFQDEYVGLQLGPLGLGLVEVEEIEPPGRVTLWFYCADVDAEVAGLREAGVEVSREPFDAEWGERVAAVRDPDGNEIFLGRRAQ
jgi:catechol 2,3-dioxygenase-like lactoylglutathione lyase family enzyme